MKFAAVIEYIQDKNKIAEIRPVHREYLRSLLEAGRLAAAGPFTDDSGALIVYEADSVEAAEALIQGDPFHQNGVFLSYEIRPWKAVLAKLELFPQS